MIRLRLLSAILLLAVCASAQAEMHFAIGEPTQNATKSGIGQISGWAVSDREIVSVEAFIDGESVGLVPYGGTRLDVAAEFPGFPDPDLSGWAMKWNYSLLAEGEHTLTVVVTDTDGNQLSEDVTFLATGFRSEFIRDPDDVLTSDATVSLLGNGRVLIAGAEVEGETVDIELQWDTASQQFLIARIEREETQKENMKPSADAGPSRQAMAGENVVVVGDGYDPDGEVEDYSWEQISGPNVFLVGSDKKSVRFTAPNQQGTVRLRLTVMDDNGASDKDDTLVNIVVPENDPPPDPDPEPEPEPEPVNQAPSANAGPDQTVEAGNPVTLTGAGTDSDGTVDSFLWSRVSGPSVTLQNPGSASLSLTAPAEGGILRLRLTVVDDDGASDSDDVIITINEPPPPPPPPNEPPTVSAGANQSVSQGENVSVSASASDPDGTISTWAWIQLSGTPVNLSGAAGPTVQFTAPDSAGDITLRVTVADDQGATASDTVVITVEEDDQPDATTGETLASMLTLINEARGQARTCGATEYPAQPPLQWSGSLASIAKLHSMDMARQGYFSHTSLDGTSMGSRVFPHWSGSRVGENIAASSSNRSGSYVVNLWLNSTGHCKLIMDPGFSHAGIGAGHNTENGYSYHHFWTIDFGG